MDQRAARLDKFLSTTLKGKNIVPVSQKDLFLEAICGQSDPATCISSVIASQIGLPSVQACMRYDLSTTFLNGAAANLLDYLQAPEIKSIDSGKYLEKFLLAIVEPPVFWAAFCAEYKSGLLEEKARRCFAWLLYELVSISGDNAVPYRVLAKDDFLDNFLASKDHDIRSLGYKIQRIIEEGSSTGLPKFEHAPGGRHDNDFADFHKISILPTADEIRSKVPPFLLPSTILDDPKNEDSRIKIYLDNQFRLLREDMLSEMREELAIVTNQKKGKKRGVVIEGLRVLDLHCGDERKRCKWGITFQLTDDIPQLKKLKPKERKTYLEEHRRILSHQSLTCLLVDNELVAFPIVHRDEELLARNPPVVILQFDGELSTVQALTNFKTNKSIKVIGLDTALFSFEPVLNAIKNTRSRSFPFPQELLFWKQGTVMQPPSFLATKVISALSINPHQDLKPLLRTPTSIKLDGSQAQSFLAGLTQRVSLIQGPPGTGKSFIGALLAKTIHDFTKQCILVVCYTNHALDQFLEDLLKIGIPSSSMVRLGGKSTTQTAPLALQKQASNFKFGRSDWTMVDLLKSESEKLYRRLQVAFNRYKGSDLRDVELLEYLEFEHREYFDAFCVPQSTDGMAQVDRGGRSIGKTYLLKHWSKGWDAGIFSGDFNARTFPTVWGMKAQYRKAKVSEWKEVILKEELKKLYAIAHQYNECQNQLTRKFTEKDASILRSKRVIGCTTTAAAKYNLSIQAASPSVLLVEEAGEILESHVLTALGKDMNQLILIGDHQQVNVNSYSLTVEKGDGYDLNRSMFERLVLKGYPHGTLSEQHRMRPEISALVRHLTYPDLVDSKATQNRPDLRGVRDNIVFIAHDHPEDENPLLADRPNSSKQNTYEMRMILKIIRYLGQQGYGTDKLVILTPYLGQLQNLHRALKEDTDPVLNDLDSYDLIRAGLISQATAKVKKNPIRLATIDNYQGEESDIVLVSLTRSNSRNDIGFMSSPERVNVLLSRARNALIMIGNAETFLHSKKGGVLWNRLLTLLKDGGHMYDGFPIRCERHHDRTANLRDPSEFDTETPDGGCKVPCGVKLKCGLHECPSKCHQLYDHSKMLCEHPMHDTCPKGHKNFRKCHQGPALICAKCDREAKLAEKRQKEELALKEKREAEQRAHEQQIAEIDSKIEAERQLMRDHQHSQERAHVLLQKRKELQDIRDSAATSQAFQATFTASHNASLNTNTSPTSSITSTPSPQIVQPFSPSNCASNNVKISPVQAKQANHASSLGPPESPKHFQAKGESKSEKEWDRQKRLEGSINDAIDSIMNMTGLEDVKAQVLRIKAKIDVSKRQNASLKDERFNIVLLGNPGTGKTTVARHYARFLVSVGILDSNTFFETTGSRLANEGVSGIQKRVEELLNGGGGTIFIDEAYQLTSEHNHSGRQVLDFLLAEMENHTDKLIFIFAGYSKQMEKFFEHNPGLKSRVPYELRFEDYTDAELLDMFTKLIDKTWGGRMKVDGGKIGLYARILIRRLGRGRGREGFGNARALQNAFSRVRERQAERLGKERGAGMLTDDLMLSKEDLIGPDPSLVVLESKAWKDLESLIGLLAVKNSVGELFRTIQTNYQRELKEMEILQLTFNKVFVGSPGTGKTTVAKLYGQILKDLGMLSNGEVVVKNPSDFIGNVLGQSESNTKAILANTLGKVLVIDEAYMLYSGGNGGNHSDPFKTAVIDTIVAEVQNVPGDDRCVILLGYKDQIVEMFENVNPGLSRRFNIENAFQFDDFTDTELLDILNLKLRLQDLAATDEAKRVAIEALSRARNRPNFGNGGEVENMLVTAKVRCQARLSQRGTSAVDMVLEPGDFDPDFERGAHAATNLKQLFEDLVDCEDIVNKLGTYQNIARKMKAKGMDPRKKIPMNFIFKGPPGTGKTTTARKMGQVYYDMGFLSSAEVVECSASDLVGQYVGHTGPKTKALFKKALGRVLFIDEAYRLAEGHFAQEAIDELVGLLTHEDFIGKLIVVLAGYDQDINRLLAINTGLSSRFPETILFKNMDPKKCLIMLDKELAKDGISLPALKDSSSVVYGKMQNLIRELAMLSSWGNARDMKTLAGNMCRLVFVNELTSGVTAASLKSDVGTPVGTAEMKLSDKDALGCIGEMLVERKERDTNVSWRGRHRPSDAPVLTDEQRSTLPTIATNTSQDVQTPGASAEGVQEEVNSEDEKGHLEDEGRDAGVSDDIWRQLQADKRKVEDNVKKTKEDLRALEKSVEEAQKKENEKMLKTKMLLEKHAKDEAARDELKRELEKARLREVAAKMERERKAAELRARQEEEQRKRKEEARVQQKLRNMGLCVAGYAWIPSGDGYRCAGGSHFVSRSQLGI